MTTALVTGGAGFIGSHVVDDLVDNLGFDVVVLDDLSGGFKENVNPRARFIQGSIVDHQLLDRLFDRFRFDYVYHLAAYAAEGLSHFIKRFNYTNNLLGIFMNRLMQGESLPIFGDGEQRRAFTYIKDIAPAIAASPLEPAARNQLFNIGSDQHYSVNELALEVIAAMDMAGRLEHREARNEVKLAFSDHSKFQRVFPHAPSTTLSQGLRHMARWAKASGIRQSREFDGIEIHKNLPPAWTAVVADEPVRAGAAG